MLPNVRFFAGFTSSSAFQYLAIFIVHLNKSRTTPFLLDLSSFLHSWFRDYGCGKATSFDDLFRKDWRVARVLLQVTSTAKIVARLGAENGSCLYINRQQDQGTWRLAREDAREGARNHTRGRSGNRRRVEMGQAVIAGDSRFLPRRHGLHGRDLQERRQDNICQRSCLEGPFWFIQLQPRRECPARDRHPRRRQDR